MVENRKVFVGNLGSGTTREDLESPFSKYGNLKNNGVTHVWISTIPFGHGYVEFNEEKDAKTAVEKMKLEGL